jgi:Cu(I)/Ag(I) efflux system membrane fusion protein
MSQFSDPPNRNSPAPPPQDEGGLRPPPGLSYWRRVWWWFDFLILVKLARLRFVGILLVIGIIITQWDLLVAYYEKWTRPAGHATAASGDSEWFCPMHPAIVRDNPKEKCPICFMPLSKRKKGTATETEPLPAGVVNRVQLSPYRIVLAGASTWRSDYVALHREIVASGLVEFNERGRKVISARVNGRIDKLLVNETGQMVEVGDVLASIYSPELAVTVDNLRQAKKSGNADQLQNVRTRLELLGIDAPQIESFLDPSQPGTHFQVRSPIAGHVIEKYVREGQYVEEGMPLYDVADLSTVWIQAQVYEDDFALLPVEQEHKHEVDYNLPVIATTRAFPNEEFHGKLKFIYPHVDQATRTLTVRFEMDNPGHKLRPGSTATIRLLVQPWDLRAFHDLTEGVDTEQLAEGRVLAVPASSVIDTGDQKIVYRESSPGVFEGVQVKLGPKLVGDDQVVYLPVLGGIAPGEQIVTSGSFLVDAETRLNPAAGSIYFGGSSGTKGSTASTTIKATTPEDPEAKIAAALAGLSPADRKLAEQQRFCPILATSRIGSMGPPVKLTLNGETVFLCCAGCKAQATGNPQKTADRVKELRNKPAPQPPAKQPLPKEAGRTTAKADDPEEQKIQAELAKLSPADRQLAVAQKFCVTFEKSRLGSMGPPVKVMIEGEPVFLCCEGCEQAAKEDPKATLAKIKKLRTAHQGQSPVAPSSGAKR